jgi:Fe-S-cluster-containing hydrogenase component 2
VDVCPFEALSLSDDHVELEWEKCMGCGVCVDQCPNEGLILKRDEKKGMPLEVEAIR